MMVGGFLYPFSEFATPKEERDKRLGYQSDSEAAIKEARALMAAAGHPDGIKGLDFMVREVAIFKLWSQAIQAMLKQALNIECDLRTVVESVWFGDAASGNFDLAIGAIVSALLDPSDYFNAWCGKDGPQNYSFWDNKEFQALSAQIDRAARCWCRDRTAGVFTHVVPPVSRERCRLPSREQALAERHPGFGDLVRGVFSDRPAITQHHGQRVSDFISMIRNDQAATCTPARAPNHSGRACSSCTARRSNRSSPVKLP
jgi:hypothetical protein